MGNRRPGSDRLRGIHDAERCEMMTFWLALAVVLALTYFGAPFYLFGVLGAGWLYLAHAPWWGWAIFLPPVLLFAVPPIRARILSRPIARMLGAKGLLPKISNTEREALEAGTVWMEGELFSGHPQLGKILEQPWTQELRSDESAFLEGPVEDVCRATDEWRAWKEMDLPPDVWKMLKTMGFFGMIIPKEYGGLGFSAAGLSAVIQKLASRSFAASVTVMIPNSLGPAELILHYGTDAQRQEFLPKLATGEHMPCFALTEPTAGSDAGGLRSRGTVYRTADGALRMRLNFAKRYTSLATVSTVIGLAFQLDDPEEHLGRGPHLGITCALIPTDTPGVDVGHRHDPLGVPFHNCAISGKDVDVSIDCIIGGPDRAGQGWRMLMDCLAAGRGITLPASSVAVAKMSARVAGAYSAVRHQFGMPVGRFEGVEEPLARLGGLSWLLEAGRVFTCGAVDQGGKPSVVSAIVKYHFTELSRMVIADAMDVVAGAGISRGPRNVLAQSYIAAPIAITVEGANILTRSMIIFGQGAMRCHPYALEEVESLAAGDVKRFDRAFWGHIGHFCRNTVRASLLFVSRGWISVPPKSGAAAKWWRKLSWSSASFSVLSDLAMIGLGGQLKRRERLTGHLGDMLSWMYLGASALRRFEAEGRRVEDQDVLDWVMGYVFDHIQAAREETMRRLPLPLIGGLLRGPGVFLARLNPFAWKPEDRLIASVASVLRKPGAQRDRWLSGVYVPADPDEAVGRIERAFDLGSRALPVLDIIKNAMKEGRLPRGRPEKALDAAEREGIIHAEARKLVEQALDAREDTIQVDAFPADTLSQRVPVPGGPTPTPESTAS